MFSAQEIEDKFYKPPYTGAARFTRLLLNQKNEYEILQENSACHAGMRYTGTEWKVLKDKQTIGWFNYYPGPSYLVEPYIQWIMDPNQSPWRKVLGEDVQAFYSKQFGGWCVFVGNVQRIDGPAIMSFLKTSRLFTEHGTERFEQFLNAGIALPIAYIGYYMLPTHGQFYPSHIHGAPLPGAMTRGYIEDFLNGRMTIGKTPWSKKPTYQGTDGVFGTPNAGAKHQYAQFLKVQNAPVDPNKRRFGNVDHNALVVNEYNLEQCITILKGLSKEFNLEDQ